MRVVKTRSSVTKGSSTDTSVFISRIESVGNTGAADTFTGSTGDDLVIAGAGNDIINAGAGNNVLLGDFGLITLTAGVVITAEPSELNDGGNDTLNATTGNDVIFGGPGNDTIGGGGGRNVLLGDRGVVTLAQTSFAALRPRLRSAVATMASPVAQVKTLSSVARATTRSLAAVAAMSSQPTLA